MTVEDQGQVVGDFLEFDQDIVDDANGGGGITLGRNPVGKDPSGQAVDDQVNVMPGTGNADVGFVAADLVGRLVVVVADEGIDELGNQCCLSGQ